MNNKIDLVEFIQNKAGYQVMWDVRGMVTEEQMREWYKELKPDDYTLKMWNDAVSYTLKNPSLTYYFKSMDDVKDWLKS